MPIFGAAIPLTVNYLFVNSGDTDALQVQFTMDFAAPERGKKIDGRAEYRRATNPRAPFTLASGGICQGTFEDREPFGPSEIDIENGARQILFFGQIAYTDELGRWRRTGFMRRYNPSTRRFELTDDSDNEYQSLSGNISTSGIAF